MGKDSSNNPAVSLVIPVYNPGAVLARTCQEVERFLPAHAPDWELLFVCDGCTDDTSARLARWAGSIPARIRLLSHSPNQGKGFAVRRGLQAARGRWRVFTDVDLAYGFDGVRRIVTALRNGADLAIAARTHADSRLIVPPALQGYAYRRHIMSQAFSLLVRRLLPLPQRDTQAGLKGLSARAVQLLPFLRCKGFGFDCELLTACRRAGLRVAEVPVVVRCDDAASTLSLRNALATVRELWSIRRRWCTADPLAGQRIASACPVRKERQAA